MAMSEEAKREAALARLRQRRAKERQERSLQYIKVHGERLERVMEDSVNNVLRAMPAEPFIALLEQVSMHTRQGVKCGRLRFRPVSAEVIVCDVSIVARGLPMITHSAELPKVIVARGLAASAIEIKGLRQSSGSSLGWADTFPTTAVEAEALPVFPLVVALRAAVGDAVSGMPLFNLSELQRGLDRALHLRPPPPYKDNSAALARAAAAAAALEAQKAEKDDKKKKGKDKAPVEEAPVVVVDEVSFDDALALGARLSGVVLEASGRLVANHSIGVVQASLSQRGCLQSSRATESRRWPDLLLPALISSRTQRRRLFIGLSPWAAYLPEAAVAAEVVPEYVDAASVLAAIQRRGQTEPALRPEDFELPPSNGLFMVAALGVCVAKAFRGAEGSSTAPAPIEDFAAALMALRKAVEQSCPSALTMRLPSGLSTIYVALDLDADAAFNAGRETYSFDVGGQERSQAELVDFYVALCKDAPLLRMLLSPFSPRDPKRAVGYQDLRARLQEQNSTVIVVEADDDIDEVVEVDIIGVENPESKEAKAQLRGGGSVPLLHGRGSALLEILEHLKKHQEGTDGDVGVIGRAFVPAASTGAVAVDGFRLGKLGDRAAYAPEYPMALDDFLSTLLGKVSSDETAAQDPFELLSPILRNYLAQCFRDRASASTKALVEHFEALLPTGTSLGSVEGREALYARAESVDGYLPSRALELLSPEALRSRARTLGLHCGPGPPLADSLAAIEGLPESLGEAEARLRSTEEEHLRFDAEPGDGATKAAQVALELKLLLLREHIQELRGDSLHPRLVAARNDQADNEQHVVHDDAWPPSGVLRELLRGLALCGRSRSLGSGPLSLLGKYQRTARPFVQTHGVYDFGMRPGLLPTAGSYLDVAMALPEASRSFVLPQLETLQDLQKALQPLQLSYRRAVLATNGNLELQ